MRESLPEKQYRPADTAVETGAALASAAAFGLFGGVVGKAVGGLGDSNRHQLSAKLGMWVGAVTLSVLSLYASFRSHQNREETLGALEKENAMLKRALQDSQAPAVVANQSEVVSPASTIEHANYEGAALSQGSQISSLQK